MESLYFEKNIKKNDYRSKMKIREIERNSKHLLGKFTRRSLLFDKIKIK